MEALRKQPASHEGKLSCTFSSSPFRRQQANVREESKKFAIRSGKLNSPELLLLLFRGEARGREGVTRLKNRKGVKARERELSVKITISEKFSYRRLDFCSTNIISL